MKKIFFYSNDFHGNGHFSRSLKIAEFFAVRRKQDEFYLFTNKYLIKKKLLPNVHVVLMPKIKVGVKPKDCRILPKLPDSINVWSDFILKKVNEIRPDIFYVDLHVNGGYGELRKVFPFLKDRSIKTVLGLREFLDDRKQTKKEWLNNDFDIVSINDYDQVFVYGAKKIFNDLYGDLINNKKKLKFINYLLPKYDVKEEKKSIDIFAMFGGGGKSLEQAEKIVEILDSIKDKKIVVLLGPLFPKKDFLRITGLYPKIKFVKKSSNVKKYLMRSRLVVTHGGYNSIMESLVFSNNVIISPRVKNTRKEQILRAKYFKKMGYCDYIDYSDDILKNRSIMLKKLNEDKKRSDFIIKSGLNVDFLNQFYE